VTGFINYIYVIIYAIKKRFDIGTVICPRAFVLDRGRRLSVPLIKIVSLLLNRADGR